MKKILCLALCVLMTLALASCGEAQPLKFGLGVYTTASAESASADANGKANAAMTFAAVSVDAAGKIVACDIDTADYTVAYTGDGKAIANDAFQTKGEQKEAYNMKTYAGSALEWYEQVDALEKLVCGKTMAEVKALVADGGKGNDAVLNAGCTIAISEFVLAIEKAYNNAAESGATADCTVKVASFTEQTCTDATADKNGSNEIEITLFAAAVDANGKIAAATSDCVAISFTFDTKGVSAYDATKAISTKKELGTNYGMSAYGTDLNGDGKVLEWNEQAAAFDAACIGKTAGDVASLMAENGYGVADLQTAGCTMGINAFVKAAAKIG